MPWRKKATKDVVSCDKLRVGAHNPRSGDFRMGKPIPGHAGIQPGEHIAWYERTGGIETSQYPQEQKVPTIFLVAASEREIA